MTCARGCTVARQHRTDCDTEHCGGCLPREAEFGRLCYGCHQRLLSMLATAPAQHALLAAVVAPSMAQTLAQETTATRPSPRVTSDGPLYMRPANRTTSSEGSEPIRLAVIDTAQRLSDILSAWVELLTADYGLHGPAQQLTTAQHRDGKHGRWRDSRWPLRQDETPEPVWTEPPAVFAIASAAGWLAAQVARLEAVAGIGDLWGELAEVMSQAHALAPWREQAAVLRGIECPCCHRTALRLFGGDDFVTCLHCHEIIEWARYAIWVRLLQERRTG